MQSSKIDSTHIYATRPNNTRFKGWDNEVKWPGDHRKPHPYTLILKINKKEGGSVSIFSPCWGLNPMKTFTNPARHLLKNLKLKLSIRNRNAFYYCTLKLRGVGVVANECIENHR